MAESVPHMGHVCFCPDFSCPPVLAPRFLRFGSCALALALWFLRPGSCGWILAPWFSRPVLAPPVLALWFSRSGSCASISTAFDAPISQNVLSRQRVRQREPEGAAFAFFALHADLSAMLFHNRF